jgi:hypothetical protein
MAGCIEDSLSISIGVLPNDHPGAIQPLPQALVKLLTLNRSHRDWLTAGPRYRATYNAFGAFGDLPLG